MEIQNIGNKRASSRFQSSDKGSLRNSLANRRHRAKVEFEQGLKETYPEILNFYTSPPSYTISLEEFEQYAVERLKVLRLIERINSESHIRYSPEYFSVVKRAISKQKDELQTYHVMFSPDSMKELDEESLFARKIDHISHFLLRLAFARTDEQRKWFLSMEVDFFRLKLYESKEVDAVITRHDLPYKLVDTNERDTYSKEISTASFVLGPVTALDCPVYKTHFIHALELVRNRKVFLHKGYAYLPLPDLAGVISQKFRSYLSESLSLLKKNIHIVEDDERLRPLVFGFEKRYLGNDASVKKSGDAVLVAELATFAEKSFPLCMKHLYDVVIKDHHLKHWGRLQLGLFFKGLGLPLEEATKFWRSNFTKRADIDANRFDKQYLYNIRHMYGQEGKRTDYTPYSCMKVISSNVGPGDHHGCPFKHSDATPLRVKLIDAGIPKEGVKEIMKLVEEKLYQLACQRYFEWTHDKLPIDGGVNHPNQYFNESRDALTGKKTIKKEVNEIKTTRTNIYKDGSSRSQKMGSDEPQQFEVDGDEIMDDDSDVVLASMDIEHY